jgi:hypothetical protein
VFVEAWRYDVAPDIDEKAATSAVHDELADIVEPFDGIADDVYAAFSEPGDKNANLDKICAFRCNCS